MEDRTLADIEREARSLIAEHCPLVRFEWDNATRRVGVCRFERVPGRGSVPVRISLSRPVHEFSAKARAEAHDTILHEIAHALAGAKAGHGPMWKVVARRIGCKAQRCASFGHEETPPARYVGHCQDGCRQTGTFSRQILPKSGRVCRVCRERVTWSRNPAFAGNAQRPVLAAQRTAPSPDLAAKRSAAARKAAATRRARQRGAAQPAGKVRPTWAEVLAWHEHFDGEHEIAAAAKRRWQAGHFDLSRSELAARRARGY